MYMYIITCVYIVSKILIYLVYIYKS